MISPNYVDNDSIKIKNVAAIVNMNCIGSSSTSIGTYALGPCIGFIIDVIYNKKKICVLDHYSFLDVDESKMTPSQQIQSYDVFFGFPGKPIKHRSEGSGDIGGIRGIEV